MTHIPEKFLLMWLGFLLLMMAGIGAVLVWAVRARQFTDQDRARYLPLHSGVPEGPDRHGGREGAREKPGEG